MTTKFVSVEDFALRSGLGDIDGLAEDVQTKVRMSIEAATTHLISILRTEFDDATAIKNQYYVDTGELPFVGEFPVFFLAQGFVTTLVAAMVVRTADQLPDLAAASVIDASYFRLEARKGTLMITGTDQLAIGALSPVSGNRYFAQIEYDAGFTSASDMFGTIYENVPDFLTEAAMIIAITIFNTGKACEDKDTNAQGCPCSIEGLISRYIRFVPSAIKPLF